MIDFLLEGIHHLHLQHTRIKLNLLNLYLTISFLYDKGTVLSCMIDIAVVSCTIDNLIDSKLTATAAEV